MVWGSRLGPVALAARRPRVSGSCALSHTSGPTWPGIFLHVRPRLAVPIALAASCREQAQLLSGRVAFTPLARGTVASRLPRAGSATSKNGRPISRWPPEACGHKPAGARRRWRPVRRRAQARPQACHLRLMPGAARRGTNASVSGLPALSHQLAVPAEQRAAAVPPLAQVAGCGAELLRPGSAAGRDYYSRYRICRQHCIAEQLIVEGRPQRFCQQVGAARAGLVCWSHMQLPPPSAPLGAGAVAAAAAAAALPICCCCHCGTCAKRHPPLPAARQVPFRRRV